MLKKRTLALALAFLLCLSLAPTALAARNYTDAENKAQALKYLGLMQGVSDTDFDLDRAPTRLEALVMFLRLMGAEDAALFGQDKHPFTDVPAWGAPYVAYAYQKGYTNGETATSFNPNKIAEANVFLTFTLRALGYSDRAGGDFTWDRPHELAKTLGLLSDGVDTKNFQRADVALISWEALFVAVREGDLLLADALMNAGFFTERMFHYAWEIAEGNGAKFVSGVRMGTYICQGDSDGYEYEAQARPSLSLYDNMSFSLTRNFGEGMETGTGHWRVETDDEGFQYVVLTVTSQGWGDELRKFYFWIDHEGDLMLDYGDYLGITCPYSFFIFDY